MSTPTFVVGTGRCGSTMLSNMLRQHPKVLSLSEFFSSVSDGNLRRLDDMFSPDAIDGRKFWEMVAAISALVSFQLRHHIEIPEFIYPCDARNAHFSRKTGVPSILHVVLPYLTDNHDELYEVLREEVVGWPERTIGEHYHHLFCWLARHFGKQLWVERSGGFLFAIEQLLATFPDARFIHLLRDGRDAALSMQAHIGFRLVMIMGLIEQSLGADPRLSVDRTHIDRVPAELRRFLPEHFDADALRAYDVSSALCGGLWAEWMNIGMQFLASVPADRILIPTCID
jgi:putative sulfotransferase